MIDAALLAQIAPTAGAAGLLGTAFVLGIRHGIDWDHIAAISDITSTSAAAGAGQAAHAADHDRGSGHVHDHGGPSEIRVHVGGPGTAALNPVAAAIDRRGPASAERVEAIRLGTLYALGHGLVVAILGLLAITFGAVLPDWIDPIMGRLVGLTLVLLGIWVFYSLYRYARHGEAFRLRSRWMLVFDGARFGWRRLQARLHGHEHAEPLEMSSYGDRTAFGVGMIHGIGAETATQVLLITAIGGAAGAGLGIPMMVAFILGLLVSNSVIVVLSSAGFVASRARDRIYVLVGLLAGTLSIAIGMTFVLELEGVLPELDRLLRDIGA